MTYLSRCHSQFTGATCFERRVAPFSLGEIFWVRPALGRAGRNLSLGGHVAHPSQAAERELEAQGPELGFGATRLAQGGSHFSLTHLFFGSTWFAESILADERPFFQYEILHE